ncbi:flagellar biosynthesis protein FlhF [Paraliomyxa miuraensis]|uniref:hypothetical protein n=1 Tax=Paraliomyxa miuraensis TaxID=376150 RepID=UPI0022504776|nr:hypothetical protein [Paraliomyxa miuraensis]MCX4247471.1 hypothetical protein [Paraliomyxa miuraensis]
MRGYLGRLAGQLAGATSVPPPAVRIGSPIVQHDQLPTVDGLESVGAAGPEPWATSEPPLPTTEERLAGNVDVPAPVQTPRIPTRPSRAPQAEPPGLRGQAQRRPPPRMDDRALPSVSTTAAARASEQAPPGFDAAPTRAQASVLKTTVTQTTPTRVAASRTSSSIPSSGVLDLARTLGHVSRTIADANRETATDGGRIPTQHDHDPLVEIMRVAGLPEDQPARAPRSPAEPSPVRPSAFVLEPVPRDPLMPTMNPAQTTSTGSSGVTIGELHIEVIREPVRAPAPRTTSPARPARPPIGPRPSKRRFAMGRS